MQDNKINSVFKTALVIIIGIFALGLLFDFISGGGNLMGGGMMSEGGHMGGSGGFYGSSFGGLISSLISILIRILMVVLVIVVILGIGAWVKETFFKDVNLQLTSAIKNDPILKTVSVVVIAILGLALIGAFLNSFVGPGLNFNYNMGRYSGGMNFGYSPAFSMAGILSVLIKIFTFTLIISLILAVAAYVKNQYEAGNLKFFSDEKDKGSTILNTDAAKPDNNKL